MGTYMDRFPTIYYTLEDNPNGYDVVKDITYPVKLLKKYAEDSRYFYKIIVKDGLKAEELAHLVYGNVYYHWIILKFNKILNAQFDWHLSQQEFDSYIAAKYGSVVTAQQTVADYYKVITYKSSTSDESKNNRIRIKQEEYANLVLDLAGTTYSLVNGETTTISIARTTTSAYDKEVALNDSRREVALIQKDYISSIVRSYELMNRK